MMVEEPPFKRQRLGRDMSWLEARERAEPALQHAATTLAGLIAPPHQAIDDDCPAGRPCSTLPRLPRRRKRFIEFPKAFDG
jgi:hypothetical protein